MTWGLQQRDYPILTPGQMNPFNQALASGLDTYQNMQKAAYLAPLLQQELMKQQYSNQLLGAQAKLASPFAQAELAQAQAVPGLTNAQAQQALATAGLTGQETSVLRQEQPYLVQQQQGKVFADPILARLYQAGIARQGGIPSDLLSQIGLGSVPQQSSAQSAAPIPAPSMLAPTTSTNTQQGATPPNQNLPNVPQIPTSPLSLMGNAPGNLQQLFGQPGAAPALAPFLFGGNPQQNWALFGSPYSPLLQSQLKAYGTGISETQKQLADDYQKYKTETAEQTTTAKNMENFVEQANKGYKNSTYIGKRLGALPSKGLFAPPGNLASEQDTDNALSNLQVQMATQAAQAGGGRLSKYLTQLASELKLGRTMEPNEWNTIVPRLQAFNQQNQEKSGFVSSLPINDRNVAENLWNEYRNQRPAVDYDSGKVNTKYRGTFGDYTTPDAINAAQRGMVYVPHPEKLTKQDLKYLNPQEKLYVYQYLKSKANAKSQ